MLKISFVLAQCCHQRAGKSVIRLEEIAYPKQRSHFFSAMVAFINRYRLALSFPNPIYFFKTRRQDLLYAQFFSRGVGI
jgi:hypothetical protein